MRKNKRKTNYGNKVGYDIFRWIISHSGVFLAYVILVPVILYYVLCKPGAYKAAAPYIKRRFPGKSWPKRLQLTYKYYFNFGQCLIDQAAINILGKDAVKIDFPDADKLKELAEEGRGIVFVTSHIGIWQQAISTLGFVERNVYLNLRKEFHSQAMGLADIDDAGVEINIISPDGFLGGVPELSTALIRGHLVAVMGDRLYGQGTGEKSDFLGEEAFFPLLPYHLALSTKSDLVIFLTSRIEKKHFLFEAKIKRISRDLIAQGKDKSRSNLLEWYKKILEEFIEKHPFMWFNFNDFWRKENN